MNLDQINSRMETLQESINLDKKRRNRISVITRDLDLIHEELYKTDRLLRKDEAELKRLEGKNLKSIFTEILGTREEQLAQERQKYLQLVLTHNGLIEEIDSLKTEKEILEQYLLDHPPALEKEIEDLTKLKEKILSQNQETRKKILQFDSRIYQIKFRDKEFEEAISEAKQLENKLKKIISQLKHVKKWGPYKLTGKGRYSSYNKKSFIDKANKDLITGNVAIKKFDKELRDLYPDMDLHFSLDHFHHFLQEFYDNLITDWLIQRKLDTTLHSIENILLKLSRIQMTLIHDHKINTENLEKIENEKNKFIFQA